MYQLTSRTQESLQIQNDITLKNTKYSTNYDSLHNSTSDRQNVVTVDVLENRLRDLIENLTVTKNDEILQPSSLNSLPSHQEQSFDTNVLQSDSNPNVLSEIESNVNILNNTVSIQGAMLRQAISALGDYDRR